MTFRNARASDYLWGRETPGRLTTFAPTGVQMEV